MQPKQPKNSPTPTLLPFLLVTLLGLLLLTVNYYMERPLDVATLQGDPWSKQIHFFGFKLLDQIRSRTVTIGAGEQINLQWGGYSVFGKVTQPVSVVLDGQQEQVVIYDLYMRQRSHSTMLHLVATDLNPLGDQGVMERVRWEVVSGRETIRDRGRR